MTNGFGRPPEVGRLGHLLDIDSTPTNVSGHSLADQFVAKVKVQADVDDGSVDFQTPGFRE